MSKIKINKLTNANVYLNGVNLLGRAEEVQLPQIKHKMAEHKALGMVGSAEFFAGIDKLECKIKWNALYPEVLLAAASPFTAAMIQVRASLETYNGTGRVEEVPATAVTFSMSSLMSSTIPATSVAIVPVVVASMSTPLIVSTMSLLAVV